MKKLVQRALTDSSTRSFFVINDILAFFTIVSILGLILETVPALAPYSFWFTLVEYVTVAIFTVEYVLRLSVAKPWYSYSISFYGVIDLVSILPTFVGVGNLTFLKSARIIRLIRFLRLIRLAKLARVPHKEIEHSLGVMGMNVAIYTMCLLVCLVVFGVGLYVVEAGNHAFTSIPLAMWWSLEVFVGNSNVTEPSTVLGEVLYVAARFVGLLLLGVLIGVVGNIFREVLLTKQPVVK